VISWIVYARYFTHPMTDYQLSYRWHQIRGGLTSVIVLHSSTQGSQVPRHLGSSTAKHLERSHLHILRLHDSSKVLWFSALLRSRTARRAYLDQSHFPTASITPRQGQRGGRSWRGIRESCTPRKSSSCRRRETCSHQVFLQYVSNCP
jgi:hypothetical protein